LIQVSTFAPPLANIDETVRYHWVSLDVGRVESTIDLLAKSWSIGGLAQTVVDSIRGAVGANRSRANGISVAITSIGLVVGERARVARVAGD